MTEDKSPAMYRILSVAGFFGPDDNLYKLDSIIEFDGEPNDEMEPLNELARERLETHLEKLDNYAKISADKAGRPFVGRPRDLEGAITIARSDEIARKGIMGVTKEATNIREIIKHEVPQTGEKRKVGRPSKSSQAA